MKQTNFDGSERIKKHFANAGGEVRFVELFTDSFMREFTEFDTYRAMLEQIHESGGLESEQEIINSEHWPAFVVEHTRFASWQEMKDAAGAAYFARKHGL